MSRALAVLRPEPGGAVTAARIAAAGFAAIRLPLFAVRALAWTPPEPTGHDALILTSANTLRHGGCGLATLRSLPVLAVGEATAEAARQAGFDVSLTGDGDAARLLATARALGIVRALHLGGRERTMPNDAAITAAIPVYASEPLPIDPAAITALDGCVALLHSARAALRLRGLIADPARLRVAAISPAVLNAAGPGWDKAVGATSPDDAALVAAAAGLAD